MNLIQLFLVLGFIAALFVYFSRPHSVLRDRVIATALVACAVLAIVFPQVTTSVAHRLGVGRGSDLLIYILCVGGTFVFLLLYIRLLKLEENLTDVVRCLALMDARPKSPRTDPRDADH